MPHDPATDPAPHADPAVGLGLDVDGKRPLRFLVEAGYAWLGRGGRGDAQAALDVFEGLKTLLPDDPAPWLGAAEARLKLGQGRHAEREAQAALRRGNASADTAASALVLLGDASVMVGRAPRAVAFYRKVEAVAPDSPSADVARSRLAGLDAAGPRA